MARANLSNLIALATEPRRRGAIPSRPPTGTGRSLYRAADGRIVRDRMTAYGPVPDVLAHFEARIAEELVLDDGAEQRRLYRIEGRLPDGQALRIITVPAEEYPSMNWVSRAWGCRAVIAAGAARKDALREAILHLSGTVPQRYLYAHTGWRRIEGRWAFLHAGGAIGAKGAIELAAVELPPRLQPYRLPAPPDPDAAAASVRASLRLLDLAPRHREVGYALLAAIYRAPLSHFVPTTVALWLYGPSGSFKTSISTLALCHYGRFDETTAPETWLSTPGALEATLWAAADLPVLVDDFAPGRFRNDSERMQDSAEQLIRRIGNHAGRHRLRADLSSAPDRPPRGAVLVTAEELPNARLSAIARLVPVPVQPDTVDPAALGQLQAVRDDLARAGAAYVQWLARALEGLADPASEFAEHQLALRRILARHGHPRVAGNVAVLALGLDMALAFAEEVRAVGGPARNELLEEGMQLLARLGASQQRLLEDEEPAVRFCEALDELLASGRAVLLPRSALPGDSARVSPGAAVLGYHDLQFAYLLPDAAYDAAQRLLASGRTLGCSPRALWQALERKGWLIRDDPEHLLAKVRLPDGRRIRVLRLAARALPSLAPLPHVEPGPPGPEPGPGGEGAS